MDDADDRKRGEDRVHRVGGLASSSRRPALAADEHAIKCARFAPTWTRSAKRDATVAAFGTYRAEVAKAAEYRVRGDVDARWSRLRRSGRGRDVHGAGDRRVAATLARTEEVRDKEELAAGLFLVDFEQLKIENRRCGEIGGEERRQAAASQEPGRRCRRDT